jgi:phospholipid/cholesterol/gamma-HCH transport system substrate-binding protein
MKRKSIAGPLIKALIFVLVTGLSTAILGVSIANTNVANVNTYYARFTDVTGVTVGDDVRIAGVKVGQVEQLGIVDKRIARVGFTVDASRTLPAGVTATIKYRNLVGQRYISLDRGPGAIDQALQPNAEIPLAQTAPALDLTALFNGFKPLFSALSPNDVNQLSIEIVNVLQGEGGTMDSLLQHMASLTSTLASKDQVFGQVIDNLNTVLHAVNSRGTALSDLITAGQSLISGLANEKASIGNAVSALSGLSNATASLLQQARPGLQADIGALGGLAQNLNNNTPLVNSFLQNLPTKFTQIAKTVSYGSWLNLYLCEATVSGVKPAQGPVIPPGASGRCGG